MKETIYVTYSKKLEEYKSIGIDATDISKTLNKMVNLLKEINLIVIPNNDSLNILKTECLEN